MKRFLATLMVVAMMISTMVVGTVPAAAAEADDAASKYVTLDGDWHYNLYRKYSAMFQRGEITEKGAKDSAQMLDILSEHARLDLGILFGWGDIRDHIANGFNKSTSAADLLADRMTEMRNKAAETAASILAGKLGIE